MKIEYKIKDFTVVLDCDHENHTKGFGRNCYPPRAFLNGEKHYDRIVSSRTVFFFSQYVLKISPYPNGSVHQQNVMEKRTLMNLEGSDKKYFPYLYGYTHCHKLILVERVKLSREIHISEEDTLLHVNKILYRIGQKYDLKDLGHTVGNYYKNWVLRDGEPVIVDSGQ